MANDTVSQDPLQAEITQLRAKVAELERVVEAQRRREELTQAVLDAVPARIYVRDTDGKLELVNRSMLDAVGLDGEEIRSKRIQDLFPPHIVEQFRAHDRAVLSTGQACDMEIDVPHNGETRTFITRKFPIFGANGEIIAIGGISSDVSASRKVESDLRESRALLQSIVDNSPNVIYARDLEGRYILANAEARRVTQRSAEEFLGKTVHDILPAALADAIQVSDKRVLATGVAEESEQVIHSPDGPRVYWNSKFALRDAQGNIRGTGGVSVDITEHERHQAEHARQQEEIIRLQQSMLRELSTPLIPIADRVVIMPLIGSIDRARAQQALEILLRGTVEHRARVAIVDITGVTQVNAEVADGLVRVARAVELLGAETVLTGIRPEVAQTFVSMGSDLRGIVTRGTLQSGIAYALGQRGQGIGGSR